MSPRVDVVSIGTLSCNPFWGERTSVRAPHATTTLVRDGSCTVLVDPSLPAEILERRLLETTGLSPAHVDAVFLTNFRPIHRRGLRLFDHATWYVGEHEREVILKQLESVALTGAGSNGATAEEIEDELALLRRTEPAPDRMGTSIHLFPSHGVTPGSCSLLVAGTRTLVVAGDAVLTRDYFEHGRVYERAIHVEQAKASLADILEVAELIIPGHDNLLVR